MTALALKNPGPKSKRRLCPDKETEGFVRIFEESVTWFDHGAEDIHAFQGLTNHTTPGKSWTLANSNWSQLRATSRNTGQELVQFLQFEIKYQDMIEITQSLKNKDTDHRQGKCSECCRIFTGPQLVCLSVHRQKTARRQKTGEESLKRPKLQHP